MANFADHADVQSILSNARRLKGREHPLYIYQQFPKEIVARRRILQPILHAAKGAKIKATLVDDRLYLDGSLYTVDNIADIPFDTSKLNESRNETTVAFLGRLSPLSNFFASPFVVDQTEVFSCVEQYFQYNKAILADDENAAAAIMCTSDPLETKRIGDAIYMNQETKKSWISTNKKIMTEALTHKFQQSTQARKALLETKELNIVEAL